MIRSVPILALAFACSAGCGSGGGPAPSGELSLLTYNVAGLPQGLKEDTHPEDNTPLISPLLNAYDLVLVQEDFTYHEALAAEDEHPFQSEPKEAERLMNDGLNRFSDSPFDAFVRQTWTECNGGLDAGSDCLADKGFSVATHALAEGVFVDVVNLHMDAGGDDVDANVRSTQVDQLLDFLGQRSAGRALLVAGDTNMKPASRPVDATSLQRLLDEANLTDACAFLDCGDDRIDRVLFRSGADVTITPSGWRLPDEFVDDQGQDLSDHRPVCVDLSWER